MIMKSKVVFVVLLAMVMVLPTMAQKKKEAKPLKLATIQDSVSYCLGILIGKNLLQTGAEKISGSLLAVGIDEVLAKKSPSIDDAKANEIVSKYMAEQRKVVESKKLNEGKAFFDKNKTESGVITTASGLQYKIIKEGNGEKPLADNKVTVHYHGTLLDGKVFDSSVDRGQPIQISVGGVIKGWQEALQLMPVGSKWKLFVPANLGYGDQQAGPIEPNSILIFEVELISIDKEVVQPELQIKPEGPTQTEAPVK